MRIIRYITQEEWPLAAVTEEGIVYPLPYRDFIDLVRSGRAESKTPLETVQAAIKYSLPLAEKEEGLKLAVPIDAPEVWAAGVTYQKSREARNYEATGGKLDATTFYDKVYDAERPEIFFKSTSARTVGPNQDVYLRSDSNWQIPEPELGLVIDSEGTILGYLVGNDMSSRDIEGENPLYLPQAKVWKNSCSIGPTIRLAETVEDPYKFEIICRIYRNEEQVFEGKATTGQLKRRFEELVSFLTRDNLIFEGTVLLTGTCVVPPNEFTLLDGDRVDIEVPGIGILSNPVKSQAKKSVTQV